jgi:hypothetical protein
MLWKNNVERGRFQMAIWRMCIAGWVTKAPHTHTHTHKRARTMCNTYCLSTTTMVARTRFNVALYVRFLSCFVFVLSVSNKQVVEFVTMGVL